MRLREHLIASSKLISLFDILFHHVYVFNTSPHYLFAENFDTLKFIPEFFPSR